MKINTYSKLLHKKDEETSLLEMTVRAKETCENCHPITPITCTTRCSIWKFKNELRKLHEMTNNHKFVTSLLNTLKNTRRLQILKILSNGHHSTAAIQQELKKMGSYHSQRTITQEYMNPLIETGLIQENNGKYRITLFGCELNELIRNFHDIGELLPPHSECHEEEIVEALYENSKTYDELKSVISTGSLSRILKRLQNANLLTKEDEKNYVFYFKTKRDPQQERLSPTEKRVYQNISGEGMTAKDVAEKTTISMRRTYKYLRKLRGKKLVFKRKRPKTYKLTEKGNDIAKLLREMKTLLTRFAQALSEFTSQPLEVIPQIPVPDISKTRRSNQLQILVESPS